MTPLSRRQLVALAVLTVAAAGCASNNSSGSTPSAAAAELTGVRFDVHRDPG
ncbi:MAG: hypothetical protein WCP59_16025 [Actinomycetota bacterium]